MSSSSSGKKHVRGQKRTYRLVEVDRKTTVISIVTLYNRFSLKVIELQMWQKMIPGSTTVSTEQMKSGKKKP